jgi:monoamine oxidase
MPLETADIVIIGAGSAGLYAAHLLQQITAAARPKVIVLEAGARIGGRVLTLDGFAPWPVDLGGEFIHGEDTLHYNFCAKHGLAMQRTFCSFPPLLPEPYFADRPGVEEYFWLPTTRRLVQGFDTP